MTGKNDRIAEICAAVIAELMRRGCLEWKGEASCWTEKQIGQEKQERLEKRVILEKDMQELYKASVRRVHIGRRAILTDLAREYADKWGMEICREEERI